MASFIAICKTCETTFKNALQGLQNQDEREVAALYEEHVLFETAHGIKAGPEEIADAMICPRCHGSDCEKTFLGYDIVGYIRGNGYLDTAGAKRDMNLFHLTANDAETGKTLDPYAEYRQPGEVEDLKQRLVRAGRHNPNTKHYAIRTAEMQKAVEQVATTRLADSPTSDS
jgi:hypothetical protein